MQQLSEAVRQRSASYLFLSELFQSAFRCLILLMLLTGIGPIAARADAGSGSYADIPALTLLATTPAQHAVLLQPDRSLLTVALDSDIAAIGARVIDIRDDHIVLQQQALNTAAGARLIRLYRAPAPGQASRVVVIEREPPPRPLLIQPRLLTIDATSDSGRD
jgi:hypothetical protein